ncbi:pickpocket protein 28-like isoform X1 [Bemisia tabaci]|uniref:pickpocket protein 28-like isoform X1 n=1 Tax=Bemisia tabaci TaxID=7038 RepID=UPI003B27F33F
MPRCESSIFFIKQFTPPSIFPKSKESIGPTGKTDNQLKTQNFNVERLKRTLVPASLDNSDSFDGPDIPRTERFLWMSLVWLIYSLTVVTIINLVYEWLTSKARFTIQSRPVNVYEIPFPALTFCSTNQFRPSAVNLTLLHRKALMRQALSPEEISLLDLSNNVCFSDTNVEESFIDDKVINYMIQKVSQKCTDVFKGVWWRDEFIGNACDYMQTVFTPYGLCFTFNPLPMTSLYSKHAIPLIKKQQELGNSGRLLDRNTSWTLEKGYDTQSFNWAEMVPLRTVGDERRQPLGAAISLDLHDYDDTCYAGFRGYHLSVHSPTETASSPIHSWYPIVHGALNQLKLKVHLKQTSESMRSWPVKKRGCYFDNERHLYYFSTYSERNCVSECLSNRSFTVCNCVPLHLPRTAEMAVCGSSTIGCVLDTFDSKGGFRAACNCLPSCTEIRYEVFSNVIPLNTNKLILKQFQQRLNISLSVERMASLTGVHVSISTKQVYPLTRAPVFPLNSFIGKVGGSLSLFMGFSVVSFLEIIFYFSSRFIADQCHQDSDKLLAPQTEHHL